MAIKDKIYIYTNQAIKYLPKPVQEWWRIRKVVQINKKDVIEGTTLVPLDELKKKQMEFLNVLLENEEKEKIGDYLEFGVYNGSSLACMFASLKETGLVNTRLFGFDSFQGLPDSAAIDDDANWYPGQYRMDYKFAKKYISEKGVDWDKTYLIKGWFSDTLNDNTVQKYNIKKASVIMVDCDMYISAKESLNFCANLIEKHAIIIFDDWHSDNLDEKNLGEKKAFEEFLHENPRLKTRDLGGYNDNSKAFYIYEE